MKKPTTPFEVLIAARALIDKEKNWTQLRMCQSKTTGLTVLQTRRLPTLAPFMYRFCSIGALHHVCIKNNLNRKLAVQAEMILRQVPRIAEEGLMFFNDGNLHSVVLAAWDEGIALEQRRMEEALKTIALFDKMMLNITKSVEHAHPENV